MPSEFCSSLPAVQSKVDPDTSGADTLRPDERLYSTLVNSLAGIVWEAEAGTQRFTFVSPQARQILGYPVDQWLSEPAFWRNHVYPEDAEWCATAYRDATRNRKDRELEYRMLAADGRVVWLRDIVTVIVEPDGQPRLRGIMIDITDSKKTEHALRETEDRWRTIFNEAVIGIALVDEAGHPIESNPAFRRMIGYTEEELRGMSFIDFTHPDDARRELPLYQELLHGKSSQYRIEKRYYRKGGEIIWVNLTASVRRDDQGRLMFGIGMVEDITERKRAEEALHRNEELLRAVVEDQTEMIVRWKPDGTRTFVNEAYCRVFGKTPEEHIGSSFFPLVVEGYRERVRQKMLSLTPENPAATEAHESISATGEIRWQEWTDRGIFDDQRQLVELQSTGRDITERKRAEEALRLSEDRYRKIVELAPEAIVVADLATGKFVDFNPQALKLFKLTPDQIVKVGPAEMSPRFQPDGRASDNLSMAQVQQAIAGGSPAFEWTHCNSEGDLIPCEVRLLQLPHESRLLVRGTITDISERKRAEAALRESEELFRAIAENSPLGIYVYNEAGMVYANAAASSLTGYETNELLGRQPWEFVHPDMRAESRRRVETRLRGESVEPRFDFKLLTKSGEVRWVYVVLSAIAFSGKPSSLGLLVDLTDQRQYEAQLRSTSEQLRKLTVKLRSAREEEGIRIAREIHDELGSALTSLKWEMEKVERDLGDAKYTTSPRALRKRVAAMTKLIDNTIGSVRRISSELRPSLLDDLGLTAAIEWQAEQFRERTGIPCSCDTSLEDLDLNPEQSTALFRIFQEALTNVLRHAQATRVDTTIEKTDGVLTLTIRDNGKGITESQKASPASLGLLGIHERAHLIGGEVDVAGIEGQGTTVTIRVPVGDSVSDQRAG